MVDGFFDRFVFIDVAVFLVFGLVQLITWLDTKCRQDGHLKFACIERTCVSNESLKVNNEAISRAAQGGVTALGILIAAAFVVLQLTRDSSDPLPQGVALDVYFAGLWFFAALLTGLWIISRLAMFGKDHDRVVLDVGVAFGLQLFATAIGVGRLVFSLAAIIPQQ